MRGPGSSRTDIGHHLPAPRGGSCLHGAKDTALGRCRRPSSGSRTRYTHHLQTLRLTGAATTRRDGGPEPARACCPVPPFRSPP
ncbi:hypothetical protein CBM2626_B50091 [Cupriavidus taiwanensis]|nr:hypothetical protein CBM2626_B50091 [Cupriavidus taiwanensis]SPA09948.1 hypothetical protein CBM2625_B60104 [Cupriavidus taiwanensis]